MTLNSSGLSVGGTFVSASDNRLKFNEKPLTNALDIINRLEPIEYDHTHDLVDQYTADTPQSHQCGFIAQSVQSTDELKHAVVGGPVGDDGKGSIRALNYNVIFTYAVKAIQELSQIVKAQQVQINETQPQIITICG
ncbi:MAG: tail fiber domain-containing protein [Candidatus Fonsibacter sp.]